MPLASRELGISGICLEHRLSFLKLITLLNLMICILYFFLPLCKTNECNKKLIMNSFVFLPDCDFVTHF